MFVLTLSVLSGGKSVSAGSSCTNVEPGASTNFKEYSLPAGNCPGRIVATDDATWFTLDKKSGSENIGKVSQDGEVTLYDISSISRDTSCFMRGPDGNIWATASGESSQRLVKISSNGTPTYYDLPYTYGDAGCVLGADNNIWLVMGPYSDADHTVYKLTVDGDNLTAQGYDLGGIDGNNVYYSLGGMVLGPDGKIWVLSAVTNQDTEAINYLLTGVSTDGSVETHAVNVPEEDMYGLQLFGSSNQLYLTYIHTDGGIKSFVDKISVSGSRTSFFESDDPVILYWLATSGNDVWVSGGRQSGDSFTAVLGKLSQDGAGVTWYSVPNPDDTFALTFDILGGKLWMPVYQYNEVASLVVGTGGTTSATLPNAVNGKTITIQTPDGTTLTCSSSSKESDNTSQDSDYTYPLGLVHFCFDTTNTDNEVSLTFVTDLKPNQVTPRKYSSTTKTYSTLPDSSHYSITETTLEGKHALKLTYTLTDNGPLDQDPAEGSITDPVGLATSGGLANTGQNITAYILTALTTLTLGSALLLNRKFKS